MSQPASVSAAVAQKMAVAEVKSRPFEWRTRAIPVGSGQPGARSGSRAYFIREVSRR
ncbi:hypothetical protein [Burkholderia stabilis]